MVKSPCSECPFRKNSLPGWLGGHKNAQEIIDIVRADEKFPCHQQVNVIVTHIECAQKDDGLKDDPLGMSEQQIFEQACREAPHCTGAFIFMNNSDKKSRDASTLKLQNAAGKSLKVFTNADEMNTHHEQFKQSKNKKTAFTPPAKRRPCFICDGTGNICNTCGESEAVCKCENPEMEPCRDCNGDGIASADK